VTSIYWITNIPTPYRNHRYERMAAIFPMHGFEFVVLFMARTESNRFWNFDPADLRYPHRFLRGIHPRTTAGDLHFNLGLFWRLLLRPPDVMVVGGYNTPSAFMAPFLCPPRTLRLLECESNLQSVRWNGWLAVGLKRLAISRYDGYVVPGTRSGELIVHLSPSAGARPFLEFPNLVDKEVFSQGVERQRARSAAIRSELGVTETTQLWICPARLEESKGLHLLFPLLDGIKNVCLLVAGEGTQRSKFERWIETKSLPVKLLGQKTQAEIVRMYAAADLFVLPSLQDPSPLSPIEACAAKLPLLVSRRIGNFSDVLDEGKNGWAFDVERPETNLALLRHIAALERGELARMGRISESLYLARFESDVCITRLALGLSEVYRRFRAGD